MDNLKDVWKRKKTNKLGGEVYFLSLLESKNKK